MCGNYNKKSLQDPGGIPWVKKGWKTLIYMCISASHNCDRLLYFLVFFLKWRSSLLTKISCSLSFFFFTEKDLYFTTIFSPLEKDEESNSGKVSYICSWISIQQGSLNYGLRAGPGPVNDTKERPFLLHYYYLGLATWSRLPGIVSSR